VGVDFNIVGGEVIVREGKLTTLDLRNHIEKHNTAARRLAAG
jgi:hypothetical protein